MYYAHGSRRWLASSTAGTTYTETCTDVRTGQTFQPKAIRVYGFGLGTGADAASQTAHLRMFGGFAVGTADRRCVGAQSQDAAGTQVCTTGYRTDCLAATFTSTPALDGALDLDALLSDGFRLIVDDQAPVDIDVFWEAWGGDDITVAVIGEIAEPAATGNQAYSVTGFTSDGEGQVVMLFGAQGTGAANAAARNDAALMAGFATGTSTTENVVAYLNDDDGSATSDTDSYCQTDECLAMCTVAGGAPSARAVLNAWQANAFQLNWIARATTNRRYIFLALKGGAWRAGSVTIEGQTGSATATVSGLPFQPLGVSLLGVMTAEPAAGSAAATEGRLALGSGSSPTSRRTQAGWTENGNATAAEVDLIEEFDQVLAYPTNAGSVTAAKDISQMNVDGFELIVDTTGGVTAEWIGYLTFGNARPPAGALGLAGLVAIAVMAFAIPPAAALWFGTTDATVITPAVGALDVAGSGPSLLQDIRIIPSAGQLAVVGTAPAVIQSTLRTPVAGAAVATGSAPAVVQSAIRAPPDGALAFTGQPPQVGGASAIAPTAGTLALAGAAPTVQTSTSETRTPGVGSLALTGAAPSLLLGTVVRPVEGAAWFGLANVLQPAAAALTLSGQPAGIPGQSGVTPPVGALTLAGAAPVTTPAIRPPVGTLLLQVIPSGAVTNLRVTPTTADLDSSTAAGRLDLGIIPSAGALVATGPAPTLRTEFKLTPPTGALAFTGTVPIAQRVATPPTTALILTGLAPNVQLGAAGNTNATPNSGALALTGAAGSLAEAIRPPAGALALLGQGGTLDRALGVPAGALTATGAAGSLPTAIAPPTRVLALTGVQTGQGLTANPAAAPLSLAGVAPSVTTSRAITPPAGAIGLAGAVSPEGLGILPAKGTLALVGQASASSIPNQLTPGAGALALAGLEPVENSLRRVLRSTVTRTAPAPRGTVRHHAPTTVELA